jgi:hypothetical protein
MRLAGSSRLVSLTLAASIVVSAISIAQEQTDFTLARGRIGPLKIGMTTDEVTTLFGQQRVKQVDLQLEGTPTPALEIRLGSLSEARASLTAEVFPATQDRIYRVNVFDRRFKTADGLGVGSTLGEVRAHHHVRMLVGEGNVVAHVDELQMSFDFGVRWYPSTQLPASARVQSVLVVLPPRELPRSGFKTSAGR